MVDTEYIEHPTQKRFSSSAKYGGIAKKLLRVAGVGYAIAAIAVLSPVALRPFGVSFGYPNEGGLGETIVSISSLVGVVAFLAFALWLYRCYRNLAPLGASKLHYSPKWAFLGFIVPIANLFVPYFFVADTWRVSQSAIEEDPYSLSWENQPIPPEVKKWWFAHLLGFVLLPLLVVFLVAAGADFTSGHATIVSTINLTAALFWCVFSAGIIDSVEAFQAKAYENQPVKNFCTRKAVCPECGHELRSKNAKQCPSCLLDWHDPENPGRLGGAANA